MVFLRVLIVLAIVATGGILAYSQQSQKATTTVAALDSGVISDAEFVSEPKEPTGLAKAWAKIKNAFDGKRDPEVAIDPAIAENSGRDLGRLGGHFKAVPSSN